MPYRRDCFAPESLKLVTFTPSNYTNHIDASLKQMFPQKLNDFHKCQLYIGLSLLHPYTYMQNESDGTAQFKGIDISILNYISRALNFDVVYKRTSELAGHGAILPNGTLTENMALVR